MISDRSGFRYPASEIVRQWDGLLVAKREEDPRHPQEFVRGVVDDYAVRNPRLRTDIESLLNGNNTVANTIVAPNTLTAERDFDFIRQRDGDYVYVRGEPNFFLPLLDVDLGSEQEVSHVRLTMTVFTLAARPYVTIYTSTDNVTFEPVPEAEQDIIESIALGEEVRIMVGRKTRYVRLAYRPPFNQLIEYNVTQFDIYGSS